MYTFFFKSWNVLRLQCTYTWHTGTLWYNVCTFVMGADTPQREAMPWRPDPSCGGCASSLYRAVLAGAPGYARSAVTGMSADHRTSNRVNCPTCSGSHSEHNIHRIRSRARMVSLGAAVPLCTGIRRKEGVAASA